MEQRMMRIALCTLALLAMCVSAFKHPTYSLDAMPSTAFTCRDKILGGYYADAETQCQMFHVCVKVAGVGVQDFRFLCPNGTAFDQEAQTCADWGDVDCEAATLYYGSDNFDLYRVGSGFESKRAPFPDEEEATFHLQRAETSDARRSKQVVVNQKAKPQQGPQPQIQAHQQQPQSHQQQQQQVQRQPASYRTTNGHFMSFNNIQTFDKTTSYYHPDKSSPSSTSARPSTPPQPQPTTPTTTTTTTTTTTVAPTTTTTTTLRPSAFVAPQSQNFQQNASPSQNYNPYATFTNAQSTRLNPYSHSSSSPAKPTQQQTRQSYYQPSTSTPIIQYSVSDDIFRGSYSSNFFNNRNNGKEDYVSEFAEKKAGATKATQKPAARVRSRGQVTYNSSQRRGGGVRDNSNVIGGGAQRPVAVYQTTTTTSTTTTSTTAAPVNRNYNNIRTNPQRTHSTNVAPVTYRPSTISSSSFRVPVTKTYATASTAAASPINPEDQFYDVPRKVPGKVAPITVQPFVPSSTPSAQLQSFSSRFNPNANYDLTAVQQSKFTYNPFGEPRVSPSVESVTSSSFNPTSTVFPTTTTTITTTPVPFSSKVPFYPTPAPQPQQSSPRGFEVIPITLQPQQKPYQAPQARPQPFSRRSDTKSYTPSSIKKFSTLVPRELYDPTTFKPATYKKAVDNLAALKSSQLDQNNTKQRDVNAKSSSSSNFVTTPKTTPVAYYQSPAPSYINAQLQSQSQSQFSSSTNVKSFNAPAPSTPFQQQQSNTFPTTLGQHQQQQQQFYSTAAPSFATNAFSGHSTPVPQKAEDIDENDGQYHPELYEKDFARYKVKNKKVNKIVATAAPFNTASFQTSAPAPKVAAYQSPASGEDEFLKTAHSQNIVASGNQLLYDQLKSNFKQQQQQSTPAQVSVASPRPFSRTAPTIPPNATTTKRPSKAKPDKDVSYDYQYYDFGADSPRDYDIDVIEDFGKLKKNSNKAKKQ